MGGSFGVFGVPEHGGVLFHFNRLKYSKSLVTLDTIKRNDSLIKFTYKLLDYTLGVRVK